MRTNFWRSSSWCCVTCILACALVARAHEPEKHSAQKQGKVKQGKVKQGEVKQGEVKQSDARVPQFPAAIVLPAMEGPKPWSDKPVLDDPDRFQIAIMTDNTGGHRPGIWMKAVERLNFLRPSFVMSVGDLIEGYSEDPVQLEAEWKEFIGFVDQMKMRFFFVAGNHDVSNPRMHELWRKKFGAEWYSFNYKGVHFVCLSSEDTKDQIGDDQLRWLEVDLRQNADARWTFLFLHKPLWVSAERAIAAGNPDATNWKKVEQLLGSRQHTVFAGHVHHYVQYDRNGMKYYHLATTGGSSQMRGVDYGEFDHIVWLTMERDGPSIANLLLDGILLPDAVTEKGIARFRDFLAKTRVEVAPILVDEEAGVSAGRIDVRLANQFDEPVQMSAQIAGLPLRGLTVSPSDLRLESGPGETKDLAVEIRFGETIAFRHLAETVLTAKIRTTVGERPLSAEKLIPVVIDRRYRCLPAPASIVMDGQLAEWTDVNLASGSSPLVLGPREQWQGPGDGSVTFTTNYDDQYVYVAAKVQDDKLVTGDRLQLRLDARPIDVRKSDPRLRTSTYSISIAAATSAEPVTVKSLVTGATNITATVGVMKTESGWQAEVAVPTRLLIQSQGANWQSFQFTPILLDVDDANEKPVEVVWRGTADVHQRNTNYGQFVRLTTK